MTHTKDHTTGCLFDPWAHLGPKRRKLMQESWAGLFRDHILCELPVHTPAPAFSADHCGACSLVARCPVKKGKQRCYLGYEGKARRIAQRRAWKGADEFKDRYRWRAGVEAYMSEYDRLTGVKHLRVRGMKTVRHCAMLKAAGLNIFRAMAVRKARNAFTGAFGNRIGAIFHLYSGLKELLCNIAQNPRSAQPVRGTDSSTPR